ncbi:MAG: hypothetical protein LBE34_13410 [Flavobacteriaceae bacterium]|jgi:hypothetical protein|nr:hypothetical protein [Flavobacteriaceae bacterium]
MMQYTIEEHLVTLRVKPASLLIRIVLLIFSVISFLATLFFLFSYGRANLIVSLFLSLLFFLSGLFLLRLVLWNTYGKEKVYFFENSIQYRAYYGWYKGKLKTYNLTPNKEFKYLIVPRGYEEEQKGILRIIAGSGTLSCATMLPISELERLIVEIEGVHI